MAKSIQDKCRAMIIGDIDRVVIIGCGGTGSILVEHVCRMIQGFDLGTTVVLYDGDVVEDANITRQNFQPHEIGANKAEALALRMAGQFGMEIAAHARHATRDGMDYAEPTELMITCTDSLNSRRIFAGKNRRRRMWLDVGNSLHHGQVVFGTTHDKQILRKTYNTYDGLPYIRDTPDIAAMNPAVMKARKRRVKAGCAAQPFDQQGFGVNAMSAGAAATIAKQVLVDRKVTTAAIYFNVSVPRMAGRDITRDLFAQWK